MQRYFFYLIVVNMLVNVIAYVPRVLMTHQFNGSVSALPVAAMVGGGILYANTLLISKFPGQGLPEIFLGVYSRLLYRILMLLLSLLWFSAGMSQVLVYGSYTVRFINPDLSEVVMYALFSLVVLLGAKNQSKSILYMLEMLLLFSLPMITFIFVKSLFGQNIRWDSVFAVMQFAREMPHFSSLAAATYLFSGYANLVIMNREFHQLPVKWLWLIIPVAFGTMCTSFFIPIGYLGADGVHDYVFAWMSTADSLRVELGFVERVIYVFYALYGLVAFASMILHWHVGLELMKSMIKPKGRTRKQERWIFGITGGGLIAGVMAVGYRLTDETSFLLGEVWLNLRLGSELFLIGLLYYAYRRKRHEAGG